MELSTFQYTKEKSWSIDGFPMLDSEQTLVLVFGDSAFKQNDPELQRLFKHYPLAHIMGCSTAGEIFEDKLNDGSISVAVMRFESTQLKMVCHDLNDSAQSLMIAEKLSLQLVEDNLAAVMMFNDGLHVNSDDLIEGVNNIFNYKIPVTGGVAADGEKIEHSWILYNGEIKENHLVMLGLYGDDLCFNYTSKGGWSQFGPERVITRSVGNILYELDGKPALSVYKNYLGDLAKDLPSSALLYPLLLKKENEEVIRAVLTVNEDDDSIILIGDVWQGEKTNLMHANAELLVKGASDAAEQVSVDFCNGYNDALVIAISCFGRRKVLRDRTEEEVEAVRYSLDKDVKMLGFYSYGEFSPLKSGICGLHNQTMTITMISEKRGS